MITNRITLIVVRSYCSVYKHQPYAAVTEIKMTSRLKNLVCLLAPLFNYFLVSKSRAWQECWGWKKTSKEITCSASVHMITARACEQSERNFFTSVLPEVTECVRERGHTHTHTPWNTHTLTRGTNTQVSHKHKLYSYSLSLASWHVRWRRAHVRSPALGIISERLVGQGNFLLYLHIDMPRSLPHIHGAIVAERIVAHEQLH
jgi:hypothetical protein